MMASAGGAGGYWILRYNYQNPSGTDIATQAGGMIIIDDVLYSQTYQTDIPNTGDEQGALIVKIGLDGVIGDKLNYYDNTTPHQYMLPTGLSYDGNKIYSAGNHQFQGSSTQVGYVAQIDPSTFSLDWFSKLPSGTPTDGTFAAYAVGDGGSNVFSVQNYRGSGYYRATIDVLKPSDGTRQSSVWAGTPREVYASTNNCFAHNAEYDTVNDYLLVTGQALGTGGRGGYEAWQFAVDTNLGGSPSLAWKRSNSGSNSTDTSTSQFIDSSQNVYIAVRAGNISWVRKRNSSGTVQWTANLSPNNPTPAADNSTQVDSVTVDSSGNVYVSGYRSDGNASTDRCTFIQKYNSSGTFQWAVTIKHTNGYNQGPMNYSEGLVLSSDESTLFCQARIYDSNEGIAHPVIIAYPTNGGLTGTYGDWTIASYTFTAEGTSLFDNSGAGITLSARSIGRDTASMNDTNSITINEIDKTDL